MDWTWTTGDANATMCLALTTGDANATMVPVSAVDDGAKLVLHFIIDYNVLVRLCLGALRVSI